MSGIEVEKISTLTGHKDCIYTLEMSDKDHIFFSAAADGMVVAWDLEKPDTGELIAKVPNSIYAIEYVNPVNQLIVGQNFEGLHLIDLGSRKEISSVKITSAAIFDIKWIGEYVIVATGDGFVLILEAENLSTIAKLKVSEKSARSIAVNRQKNVFAVGFSDNSIRIFDLKKFDLIYTIPAHQNSIFTLEFSKDGRYLLSGGRDAHLKIWDVEDGFTLKESIVAHMYAINDIDYRSDGKYFASCSMDKSIKVWEAEKFKLLKVIDKSRHAGHGTSVNKLLWSSYNDLLISCSDDRTISIWRLQFN
jgi:WD40 repeat protein